MSGEIKTAIDRVSAEKDKIKQDFEDIKTALTEKKVEVPQETHLSGIPDLIRTIEAEGNATLKIEVTADDYEGATFTATHSDTETKVTAVVSEKKATLKVPKAGTYTVSNDADEQTQEAVLIDSVDLTFNKFKATIKVTLEEGLVGETITCKLDAEILEQKAETTTVTFEVKKKGNWTIGVKSSSLITAQVDVQEPQEYTANLKIQEEGVPIITVRSKEEDNGKTVKCTKDETVLQKTLKDRQCVFILPEIGTWKITCDDYPEIQKEVNVIEAKGYRCSLRASTFGVKITESESDPTSRVAYTDDAEDMTPVKITLENGTVDYGEWKDTWIFEKIYPVMLKTATHSNQ